MGGGHDMQNTGGKVIKVSAAILALAVLLFIAYTWLVLSWSYSNGERAGYVQKFSHKGWMCKTWEGEMALVSMPGTVAEKFYFSVRDDAIAKQIEATVGNRVALTYEQHLGVPSTCFGETQYFITAVTVVAEPGFTPKAAVPAAKP
jgi:4-amino-4-deoxy-L-arabinose transferase-like glycosyltransferase